MADSGASERVYEKRISINLVERWYGRLCLRIREKKEDRFVITEKSVGGKLLWNIGSGGKKEYFVFV